MSDTKELFLAVELTDQQLEMADLDIGGGVTLMEHKIEQGRRDFARQLLGELEHMQGIGRRVVTVSSWRPPTPEGEKPGHIVWVFSATIERFQHLGDCEFMASGLERYGRVWYEVLQYASELKVRRAAERQVQLEIEALVGHDLLGWLRSLARRLGAWLWRISR